MTKKDAAKGITHFYSSDKKIVPELTELTELFFAGEKQLIPAFAEAATRPPAKVQGCGQAGRRAN